MGPTINNGEIWKVKNLKAFWQLEIEHNKVQFGVEGERAVTQVKSHQGQKFHLLSSSGCGQCGLWTRKLLSSRCGGVPGVGLLDLLLCWQKYYTLLYTYFTERAE